MPITIDRCKPPPSLVLQDTLEVFVETPEAAAPTKKLKKGLSKVFGRKDSDSDDEAGSVDATSGVGEAEEALDGHLFSVGVAFAQVRPALSFCQAFLGTNACTDRAASNKLTDMNAAVSAAEHCYITFYNVVSMT